MNYRETLDFLFSQLPTYQFIGSKAYKPSLENTLALCKLCGDPQNKFKSIHVAGTNGKGSVSHMLASILQEQGYKVGLFTSPHLKDFSERIKINGKTISKKFVVDFTKKNKKHFTKIKPSFFEMTMAMASLYFAEKKVDYVIFETGLGGRLDSTNILNPILSVITNISKDHTQLLGNTLTKIAAEKAGIFKKNTPVVIGESTKETLSVFQKKSKQLHAPLYLAEQIGLKKKLKSDLKGDYQLKNQQTVLKVLEVLINQGIKLKKRAIEKGIEHTVKNTGLRGRWEIIQKNPMMVADIAHNEAGIAEVVKQLKKEKFKSLHIVLGTVNDKDVNAMLKLLPKNANYYFTKAKIPRALSEIELSKIAGKHHLKGTTYSSVKKAVLAARKNTGKNDFIYVGGSAFVVAEVI